MNPSDINPSDDPEVNGNDDTHNQGTSKTKTELIEEVINRLHDRIINGEAFASNYLTQTVNELVFESIITNNIDVKRSFLKIDGEEIQFCVPSNPRRSTIFYHSTVSRNDLMEKIFFMDPIKEAASTIRESLLSTNFNLNDSFCDASDLKTSWEQTAMPESLLKFFAELFNFDECDFYKEPGGPEIFYNNADELDEDDSSTRSISQGRIRKITSLYQTICYILHGGKEKTPLQVMLGMVTHNTCKSAALITIFNRLGMSISYDEIRRMKSRLA